MKKLFIVLGLFIALPLTAESYVYGTTGMTAIIPTVGIGYRTRCPEYAWDFSGRVGTYTFGNDFPTGKLSGRYLYYPKQERFYVGTGVGAIFFPEFTDTQANAAATLDGVLGWEWRKAFLQLEIATPIATLPIPIPSVTFGFHF